MTQRTDHDPQETPDPAPTSRPLRCRDWPGPWSFALLLGLAVMVAFPGNLVGVESFWWRDFGNWVYPNVHHVREAFWRGEVPLWNPWSDCGGPFLAQWSVMCLYPGALVYVLLPIPWSINLFALLHLWLGGVGMYLLARRWTGSALGAAVAGLAFSHMGMTQSSLEWPHYTAAIAWMPLVVNSVQIAWTRGGRFVVISALAGAMQFLTGAPEILMITWLVASGLWLADVLPDHKWDREMQVYALTSLTHVMRAAALCAGLVASQFLPFMDLVTNCQRTSGVDTSDWGMPALGTANLVFPLFGAQVDKNGWYRDLKQGFFRSTYLGLAVGVLAIWGAHALPRRRTWLLAMLAGVGSALAMGVGGLIFPLAERLLPSFAIPRFPVKFLLLTGFALPVLAAHAFTPSALGIDGRRIRVIALLCLAVVIGDLWIGRGLPRVAAFWSNSFLRLALGSAAIVLFVLWSRMHRLLSSLSRPATALGIPAVLLLILWVDFRSHYPGLTPVVRTGVLGGGLPGQGSRLQLGEGRVFADAAVAVALQQQGSLWQWEFYRRLRVAAFHNLNLLDSISKVDGGAVLRLRHQDGIDGGLYRKGTNVPSPLLDFLGVNWTLSLTNLGQWNPRPGAMPLVTAGQRPVYLGEAETLTNVLSASFQPREEAYLLPEVAALKLPETRAHATVTDVLWERQSVAFDVTTDAPTLAMVSQTWHRWWRARVDGTNAPVLRANYAFQAVPVPAGQHRVVLEYVDRPFQVGAVISGLSLLVCGWIWFRSPPRPRGEAAAAG